MDIDKPDRKRQHDLTQLEQRLAAWRPSTGSLDRDRMLYDAGRVAASVQSRIRSWQAAAAGLFLLAAGLGGGLVHERSQRHRLETVLATRTQPPAGLPPAPALAAETPPIEAPPPTSYFALMSRLPRDASDPSSAELDLESESHRLVSPSSEAIAHPGPLLPRDVQRILDL